MTGRAILLLTVDVEKEIDKLYAAPPEEFVAKRKALAQKLRKDGERAEAMRIEDLRKPTAAAAVVNQLARTERMNVRALLAAGERLHDAQASLMQGGKPEGVRKATDDERKAIAALLTAARREGVSDTILRRVEATLHAAAISAEGRAALAQGRLTQDLDAAGFGLEGMPAPRKKPKQARPKVDREAQKRQRALEKAQAELEAARKRSSDASEAVRLAEEQVRELERLNR